MFIASELIRRGRKPLAVLRGYKGNISSAEGVLVSEGDPMNPLSDYKEAGDEAMLLATVRGLKTAAGRDRAQVIRKYSLNCDTVILDDAFQNPSVYRNHELVLIDATVPAAAIQVFPSGKFREGLDSLYRADTVVLTRSDLADPLNKESLKVLIRRILDDNADRKIFESSHSYTGLVAFKDYPLKNRKVRKKPVGSPGAFCGIGNPSAFFQMLENQGFSLKETGVFPDHHPYTEAEIAGLMESHPDLDWITTEKDIIRIRSLNLRPEYTERLWIAMMEFRILEGRETEFIDRLLQKA